MFAPRQVFAENGVGQQRGNWFHENNIAVGQTIAFCGLLGWAFGPRNFMKNCQSGIMTKA
jgi:hypothetical protein